MVPPPPTPPAQVGAPAQAGAGGFGERLNSLFQDEARAFSATVPFSGHLTDPTAPLHDAYYVRHRIETVHRIRLTARTDALALAQMVDEDYDCAREWAAYTVEELGHDRLFLSDLAGHGVTEEQALQTPPFPATRRLISHLTTSIMTVGSAAAVAYALFVEWNSERVSEAVVARAEAQYGSERTRGGRQHLGIDAQEDHYTAMVGLAYRIALKTYGEDRIYDLVRQTAEDLRDYFTELYEATVGAA